MQGLFESMSKTYQSVMLSGDRMDEEKVKGGKRRGGGGGGGKVKGRFDASGLDGSDDEGKGGAGGGGEDVDSISIGEKRPYGKVQGLGGGGDVWVQVVSPPAL